MMIRKIELTGLLEDVSIRRTSHEGGAVATVMRPLPDGMRGPVVIGKFTREHTREQRLEIAASVAEPIYGLNRRGRADAPNSSIHELLDLIDRVAGF